MKKEEKELRIQKALESLDGMNRAEANPFLYTRVMQAIKNKEQQPALIKKWAPVLAAALIIFMGLNAYTFFHFQESSKTGSTSKQGIEAFADEYGINDNSNS